MEAGAELEQRRDAAMHLDRATRRARRAGHQLEQRRLARPVRANDAERLALLDLEGDVLECLDDLRRAVLPEERLLQRAAALAAHAIGLRDVLRADGETHASKSDRRVGL